MLSSYRFLCLPLCLLPWTVPCRIVLASPDDRVTCPYHFSRVCFQIWPSWRPPRERLTRGSNLAWPMPTSSSSAYTLSPHVARNWVVRHRPSSSSSSSAVDQPCLDPQSTCCQGLGGATQAFFFFFFCGRSAVLRPSVHMLPGIGWCDTGLLLLLLLLPLLLWSISRAYTLSPHVARNWVVRHRPSSSSSSSSSSSVVDQPCLHPQSTCRQELGGAAQAFFFFFFFFLFFCGRSAVLRPSVHMSPGIGWCGTGLLLLLLLWSISRA